MTSTMVRESLKLMENAIIRERFEMDFLKDRADSCLIMVSSMLASLRLVRRMGKEFSKSL